MAHELDASDNCLQNWKRQIQHAPDHPFPGQSQPADFELTKTQRENACLKEYVEILKKLSVSSRVCHGEILIYFKA